MGAVEAGALDEPYSATPFWTLVRKRAGWLLVLFLGEMLTATAMGRFEEEIARAVVLALFVPLIISSGGNSGSQAASLIIRALAVGELRIADWWRVMRREIFSGLVLGGILGLVGFLRITPVVARRSRDLRPALAGRRRSRSALALVGVVLWGTVTGSMLPLVLKRVGLDPAVLVRAVRRHPRRRHRARHLLRGGSPAPARHSSLSGRGRYPSCVHSRACARAQARRSVTGLTAVRDGWV